MKVIAGGLDKKEEPEIVIGGKVIALEVPEELTEIFDNLAYSLIGRCRRPIDEEPECDPDKEESREDNVEYSETWKLAARISEGLAERAADNLMKIAENLTLPSNRLSGAADRIDNDGGLSVFLTIAVRAGLVNLKAVYL